MSGQEPLAILLIQINDKLFETLSDTLLRSGTDHYYVLSGKVPYSRATAGRRPKERRIRSCPSI